MSWLTKALGRNTLKVGAMIAGAYFGGQYLFGAKQYGTLSDPTALAYNPDTLAGKVFNKFDITPFQETAFGQSKVGQAITGVGNFLNIGKGSGAEGAVSLFSQAMGREFGQFPAAPQVSLSGDGARSALNFHAGRAQLFQTGKGGALAAALGREATQQYLAKQVQATIGIPTASKLPEITGVALPLKTTASRRRSYKIMAG